MTRIPNLQMRNSNPHYKFVNRHASARSVRYDGIITELGTAVDPPAGPSPGAVFRILFILNDLRDLKRVNSLESITYGQDRASPQPKKNTYIHYS
jgi:hypothetical protein